MGCVMLLWHFLGLRYKYFGLRSGFGFSLPKLLISLLNMNETLQISRTEIRYHQERSPAFVKNLILVQMYFVTMNRVKWIKIK